MRQQLIHMLAIAAAKTFRGSHNNQLPCALGNETMYHPEIKYLSGNSETPGSIFARCWMGQAVCHIEEAIADQDDFETLPCAEAFEEVASPEHHRKLQIWGKRFWPDSTICYHPIGSEYSLEQKRIIEAAFVDFEEKTNLRFVNLNQCTGNVCGGCQHGLKFYKGNHCSSGVGYKGERQQTLSLHDGCFFTGTFTPIHELGHAAGLLHEHQHPDRKLILLLDNLPAHASSRNYGRIAHITRKRVYDPSSVMHYKDGPRMCVPKGDPNEFCDFGENEDDNCKVAKEENCDREAGKGIGQPHDHGLSNGDVAALQMIYPNVATGKNLDPKPTTDTGFKSGPCEF